jgi:hypothetical protein
MLRKLLRHFVASLAAASMALTLMPTPVFAQVQTANVVSACGTTNGASYATNQIRPVTIDTTGGLCPGGNASSPTIVTPATMTPVTGALFGLTVASATTLTVPATATTIFVTVENNTSFNSPVNFSCDSGAAPTTTTGNTLSAGDKLILKSSIYTNCKFIQTQASGAIDVSYWKSP